MSKSHKHEKFMSKVQKPQATMLAGIVSPMLLTLYDSKTIIIYLCTKNLCKINDQINRWFNACSYSARIIGFQTTCSCITKSS